MMSSTLGAPLGGTIRAGQKGFEPLVERSIVPPNFCGGAGSCLPSRVRVALGEPGTPVVPWAKAAPAGAATSAAAIVANVMDLVRIVMSPLRVHPPSSRAVRRSPGPSRLIAPWPAHGCAETAFGM